MGAQQNVDQARSDPGHRQVMRVLFILAHPDDESWGNGTTIARHVAAGVDVHLVCVTQGGAGWGGLPVDRRPEELPEIRAHELERAAKVLGLASVMLWDYPDGGVPDCDQAELSRRIGAEIERLAPHIVVGWGPDGGYGHPDHIAVGACTDAAVDQVAPSTPAYHMAADARIAEGYRRALALAGAAADSFPMTAPDRVSLVFEPNEEELRVKAAALGCHESQLQPFLRRTLADPGIFALWGPEGYIRIGSDEAESRVAPGLFPELG